MIAMYGIVVGLLVGLVRGGSLGNLASLQLRLTSLVYAGLAVQLLIFPTPWWPEPPLEPLSGVLHLASYALLIAFLVTNRSIKPFWGVAVGLLSNVVVIAANGGHMPADVDALNASGQARIAGKLLASSNGIHGNVVRMSDATHLNILGDWIPVPSWLPLANSVSPGDVVLTLSAVWLVERLMHGVRRESAR